MYFLTPHTLGTNLRRLSQGTVVGLPDGSTTITTHSKNLLLPTLPPPATKGEIGPFQQCLISIPQLTRLNYKVSFHKEKATVYMPTGTPILTGPYCPRKKLFFSPNWAISPPTIIPKFTNIRQQRPNFYIGQKTKPGNLVPPHLFFPSGQDMDQGNKSIFLLNLARSHQKAD